MYNTVSHMAEYMPNRWMLLKLYCAVSGMTRDAFNGKVSKGILAEGKHWIKDPSGKICVDWRAMDEWTESNYEQEFLQQARNR